MVPMLLFPSLQLKSSDFAVLKRLVPLLEEVSCTHPDPVIQELAADLRITICTHGAFSTETVDTAAESVLGKKLGPGRTEACTAPCQSPGAAGALPQHGHSCGHPSAPRESEEQTVHGEPSAVGPAAAPSAESSAPAQLHELLLSAYDPQVPVRAAALRSLSSLIMQRDPEALQIQEKILQVQDLHTITIPCDQIMGCVVKLVGQNIWQCPPHVSAHLVSVPVPQGSRLLVTNLFLDFCRFS